MKTVTDQLELGCECCSYSPEAVEVLDRNFADLLRLDGWVQTNRAQIIWNWMLHMLNQTTRYVAM